MDNVGVLVTPGDISPENQRRIELTARCRDADPIPKVAEAGSIVVRDGERAQVMHNGVLVVEDGYYGAWMTEVIRRLGGHHEPQEEAAFHVVVERLRRDEERPVVLELGSFWAYYALWVKRVLPGAELLLVEPDPANIEIGRRNVALNGASARFIEGAVGREHGATVAFPCESDGIARPRRTVTIDGLLTSQDVDRFDVVIADVQGAELDVLTGAERALSDRRIRFLVLSTHHHSISGDPLIHQRCLEVLEEHGAHVIAEHTVSESVSGDGLIVGSLHPRDRDLEVSLSHARARNSLFGELEHELARAWSQRDEARAEADALRAQLDAAGSAP